MVKTRMPFQLLLVMPTPLSKSSSRISTPCSVGLVFLDSTHALTWQLSFWTRVISLLLLSSRLSPCCKWEIVFFYS